MLYKDRERKKSHLLFAKKIRKIVTIFLSIKSIKVNRKCQSTQLEKPSYLRKDETS